MKRALAITGVVVVVSLVAIVAWAAPTYIGAEKCKMCHKVQYESWMAIGTHSKALEKAKTGKNFGAPCLVCHSTNKSETAVGVECEACHGPGSDYKALSVMKDRAKAVAAGLIVPTQQTCDGCHNGKDHSKKVDIKTAKVHDHKAK